MHGSLINSVGTRVCIHDPSTQVVKIIDLKNHFKNFCNRNSFFTHEYSSICLKTTRVLELHE